MTGMKQKTLFVLALSAVVMTLSLLSSAKSVKVEMKNAEGKSVGSATIKPAAAGVEISVKFNHLPPGQHALHIHQTAQCDAPDFKSAGPHFNPDGKKHGLENPDGHHAGDMSNFTADAKGDAKVTILNKDVNFGDDAHSLFSNGGTSLVIHAKADDMVTDPAGNAGDRIACGVIKK